MKLKKVVFEFDEGSVQIEPDGMASKGMPQFKTIVAKNGTLTHWKGKGRQYITTTTAKELLKKS